MPDGLPKRVLAVGAHPDDIELLCGGTMALYAELGVEVTFCSATNGDRGSVNQEPAEIARVRAAEARSAADVIGARYVETGISDCALDGSSMTMRDVLIDVVRDAHPDVVFTHDPQDYHADHRAASKLVFEATFIASVPLVETKRPATEGLPSLYYMDTLAGAGFLPEQYVDITSVFPKKREMLARHTSQVDWMLRHDRLDFLDFMTTAGKFRGYQCGVAYAEGFRAAHVWLRDRPYRVLP